MGSDDTITIATKDGVRAVLDDERFVVAAAPPDVVVGTIGWLRANVSRFVNGDVHQVRRARVQHEIDRIDPVALRADAHRRAAVVLAAGDVGSTVIEQGVPLAALAAALLPAGAEVIASIVPAVAAAYFPGADDAAVQAADDATAELVLRIGSHADDIETVVARIAVLVQSCTATAGLIHNAVAAALHSAPETTTDQLLAVVLRDDPPVPALRRVADRDADVEGLAVPAGTTVVCDVTRANRTGGAHLTFGAGLRPCPGQPQALALAGGVVDAVRAVT